MSHVYGYRCTPALQRLLRRKEPRRPRDTAVGPWAHSRTRIAPAAEKAEKAVEERMCFDSLQTPHFVSIEWFLKRGERTAQNFAIALGSRQQERLRLGRHRHRLTGCCSLQLEAERLRFFERFVRPGRSEGVCLWCLSIDFGFCPGVIDGVEPEFLAGAQVIREV
jgi:hypothetical protein